MDDSKDRLVKLTDDNNCFACGDKNPQGLHLSFEYSDDGEAAWTSPVWFESAPKGSVGRP